MINLKSRLKTPESSWYPATITRHNHIELLNVIEAAINEPIINGVVDGGNEQRRFLESCFGHFLRMHRELQFSGAIVHRLLLRELHHNEPTDEMQFMLGSHSVRFSKVEFCLITGLKFGVIPDMTQIEEVENGLHQRYFSSRDSITLKELQARIVQGEWQQQYDVVKLCLVLLLNCFLMGLDEREYIPIWQLRLVDDLVSFEAFPWGSHVKTL